MHNCVRCGRAAASLEEINNGCPCGSKVFVFNKESVENKEGGSGKAPDSYFARTTFTSEDVENIKILREGVFLVDIKALSNNPVVLKDEEGVYYVKLPFENSVKINGKPISGDGGNAKDRL